MCMRGKIQGQYIFIREGFEIQDEGIDEATGEKRLCNDMAVTCVWLF